MSGELRGLVWATATKGASRRGAARELLYAMLGRIPGADPAYERWRHSSRLAVTADPRGLVLDGYPGSGNSWATEVVLVLCEGRPLAHHRHRPAQILEGVRRGLPTGIIVREPVEAIASRIVRHGGTPEVELHAYSYFHARCWPVASRVEVFTFEQATTAPESIIDRLNRRFAAGLPPLSTLGADAAEQIAQRLEGKSEYFFGEQAAERGAMPAPARAARNQQVREQLLAAGNERILSRCRDHYRRYVDLAERQAAAATAGS